MSVFAFQSANPEADDCLIIKNDDERTNFNINLNTFNVNLLKLKQKLIKLKLKKIQRDLINIIIIV